MPLPLSETLAIKQQVSESTGGSDFLREPRMAVPPWADPKAGTPQGEAQGWLFSKTLEMPSPFQRVAQSLRKGYNLAEVFGLHVPRVLLPFRSGEANSAGPGCHREDSVWTTLRTATSSSPSPASRAPCPHQCREGPHPLFLAPPGWDSPLMTPRHQR